MMLRVFSELLTGRVLQEPAYVITKHGPVPSVRSQRIAEIDLVRGLAMIFMLFNHATWHVPLISFRVNFGWDTLLPPLPAINPFTWLGLLQGTPLFFITAGCSIAIFEHARRNKGWDDQQISRYFFIRGGALILIDWLILPWQFYPQFTHEPSAYSVLTAMGVCLWFIALLRLLPPLLTGLLALLITLAVQVIYRNVILPLDVDLIRSLFLYMSPLDPVNLGFPVLPWLAVMLMGYLSMRYLVRNPDQFGRVTLLIAMLAWACWFIVTGFNDFGVLFTYHPLLMTKHPPSLAYLSFYTGVAYLLLYFFHIFRPIQALAPFRFVAQLGQMALIFYITHFYVIDIFSALLQGLLMHLFLMVLLIAFLSLPVLYVISGRYRALREAHRDSFLQYL